jgi:hypothetical protein
MIAGQGDQGNQGDQGIEREEAVFGDSIIAIVRAGLDCGGCK